VGTTIIDQSLNITGNPKMTVAEPSIHTAVINSRVIKQYTDPRPKRSENPIIEINRINKPEVQPVH
jgi:hypothetical protein